MSEPVEPDPLLTTDQTTAVANAGAGSLSDLAKQALAAGGALLMTADEAKDHGAGFVPDLLKMFASDQPLPYTASIVNVSNANPAVVSVSADDFDHFLIGDSIDFEGTGNSTLDGGRFSITNLNNVGKSFKIDCDLSAEPSPIKTGTVTSSRKPPQPAEGESQPKTMLDEPPPPPEPRADVQIADGYPEGGA